jgi:hypothetical protein
MVGEPQLMKGNRVKRKKIETELIGQPFITAGLIGKPAVIISFFAGSHVMLFSAGTNRRKAFFIIAGMKGREDVSIIAISTVGPYDAPTVLHKRHRRILQ